MQPLGPNTPPIKPIKPVELAKPAAPQVTEPPAGGIALPPLQAEQLPAVIAGEPKPPVEELKAQGAEQRRGLIGRLMGGLRGNELDNSSTGGSAGSAGSAAAARGMALSRRQALVGSAALLAKGASGTQPATVGSQSAAVGGQRAAAATSNLLAQASRAFMELDDSAIETLIRHGDKFHSMDLPKMIMELEAVEKKSPDFFFTRFEGHMPAGDITETEHSNSQFDLIQNHPGYEGLDERTQGMLLIHKGRIDPADLPKLMAELGSLSDPEAQLKTIMERVLTSEQVTEFERAPRQAPRVAPRPSEEIADLIENNPRLDYQAKSSAMMIHDRMNLAEAPGVIAQLEALPKNPSDAMIERILDRFNTPEETESNNEIKRLQGRTTSGEEPLRFSAPQTKILLEKRRESILTDLKQVTEQLEQAGELSGAEGSKSSQSGTLNTIDSAAKFKLKREHKSLTRDLRRIERNIGEITRLAVDAPRKATWGAPTTAKSPVDFSSPLAQSSGDGIGTLAQGAQSQLSNEADARLAAAGRRVAEAAVRAALAGEQNGSTAANNQLPQAERSATTDTETAARTENNGESPKAEATPAANKAVEASNERPLRLSDHVKAKSGTGLTPRGPLGAVAAVISNMIGSSFGGNKK